MGILKEAEDFYNLLAYNSGKGLYKDLQLDQQIFLLGMYAAYKKVDITKNEVELYKILIGFEQDNALQISETLTSLIRENIKQEMSDKINYFFSSDDE